MSIEEQWTVAEPVEELEEILLDDFRPKQTIRISIFASLPVCQAITTVLKENQDVFAWSHEDMPGIDLSVMVHKLNVSPFFPLLGRRRKYLPKSEAEL